MPRMMPSTPDDNSPSAELSSEYVAFKARLDASDMWEGMNATERLPVILETFAPAEWFGEDALPTLACYRERPPGRWGQIKATFKGLGGNPFDLEKAVDTLIDLATAEQLQSSILPEHRPCLTTLDSVTTESIEWLWWPYLALGKLAILDGDPGVGKSLLTLTLAACLSQGWALPDQQGKLTLPIGHSGTTLLLSAEDGLADTIKPRLEAAGADCQRIVALTGWQSADPESTQELPFTLQHMVLLASVLRSIQPRLVIIDPIQAYLGGRIDINRANETRPLLAALAHLATLHHCAILLIRHPAKGGQGHAITRGLGSIDFMGAARSGLFVEQQPGRPDAALLCQTKNNLGPLGRTQRFTRGQEGFTWAGVSRITAETLAGGDRGPEPDVFLETFFWLEQRLEGGMAWSAKDMLAEAELVGYSKKMLYKAKKALVVISRQTQDGWTWRLPSLSPTTPVSGVYDVTGVTGISGESDVIRDAAVPIEGQQPATPDIPKTPDIPDTPLVYTREPELLRPNVRRVPETTGTRDDARNDGICPSCHHAAWVIFAVTGSVCLDCGHCQRPEGGSSTP